MKIPFKTLFVDLCLPSKTIWCKYNLGVNLLNLDKMNNEKDWYGNFYSWGEIKPKFNYILNTYKYNIYHLTKYCNNSKYGILDYKNILDLEDDASYQFNNAFRIPSKEQFEELIYYTK